VCAQLVLCKKGTTSSRASCNIAILRYFPILDGNDDCTFNYYSNNPDIQVLIHVRALRKRDIKIPRISSDRMHPNAVNAARNAKRSGDERRSGSPARSRLTDSSFELMGARDGY